MRIARAATIAVALVGVIAFPGPASAASGDLQELVDAAAPGTVLEVPPGTYSGGVTIEKPLELRGGGLAVVDSEGDGNGFEVLAPDVIIDGFLIRNTGNSLDRENAGISARNAPGLEVRDNEFENVLFGVFARESAGTVISDNVIGAQEAEVQRRGDAIRVFESPNSMIERNQVAGGRDTVVWFSDATSIIENRLTGGRYGVHLMYSDDVVVENNWIENNSVGGFFMYSADMTFRENVFADNRGPSGYGVGLKDVDGILAEGNRFVGNRVGLYLDNSPSRAGEVHHFSKNVFAYNDIGVEFLPSVDQNSFSENAFIDNREQVGVTGGGGRIEGNSWTVDGVGNHWSDYAGYDADDDGIGDVSYAADKLFSDLTDRYEELTFFAETPAAQAVDMAARAFPVLRPEPKVVDDAPLVGEPDIPPVTDTIAGPSRTGLLLASAMLIALAVFVIWSSGAYPRRRLEGAAL